MPVTSRSGTSGKLRSEIGRSGSPSKSRIAHRPAAFGAGNLENLAQVKVTVDALQRAGLGAVKPAEQAFQRFFVRSDGGSGLRPA